MLLAELPGEDVAKMAQMLWNTIPHPPFGAGMPENAGPEIMGKMQEWLGPMSDVSTPMCAAAAKDIGKYMPIVN